MIDTSVLIDFSKGFEPATTRMLTLIAQGDDLGFCGICVGEFFYGLPIQDRPHWRQFLAGFSYWDITLEDAIQAGTYCFDFARRGRTLSINDATIAAVAKANRAAVVTSNAKDFPMTDVVIMPVPPGRRI